MQNTEIGNNYNPVGISETEVESILKKSVKTKLKLLGTMVNHSEGSDSLELGF